VAAVVVGDSGNLRLGGRPTTGVALHKALGDLPVTVLSGRLPAGPGEIAVGLIEQRRLGVRVGDRVTMRVFHGEARHRSLRVVGLVVLPDVNDERLGTGVIVSPRDLRAGNRGQPYSDALVAVRRPADVEPMFAELSRELEMQRSAVPRQIRNLAALGPLPSVLAGFLALLSVIVLAHSLLLTTRRRGPDLAVLRVLGMTPRQVAATVGVMAATLTVIGLVLGPVLGLALGRVVWAEVAANVGVAGDLAVPWWLFLGVLPGALLLTVLVAVLPARRAARLSPSRVLRSE
jgi:predicted lysophospholipase L1 biosynthesis ABC-type transport system permease subunit